MRFFEEIDQNKYVPQRSNVVFRIGYEPFTLVVRLIFICIFLGVVFVTPAVSPREKVDKSWLISFCIVMMIYFTCLHAFAYFPTALFGNFPHCLESAMNMSSSDGMHNNSPNQRSHAYCTAFLAFLLVIWPLMTFAFLIKQGFDPYEDLTKKEWTVAGGTFSPMLWCGRTVCHFILTFLTVYLLALWGTVIIVRNVQKNGDKVWIAQKIGSMPFGSIFFQEGLYFDCGICL